MSQFFVLPEKIKDGRFIMDPDESHHVLSAMRHEIGSEITIFDGQGNKYLAEIEEIKNKLVHGRILKTVASPDYKIRLNLCFSVVSKPSIDFILKHCTEIGVHSFQPVISERTQFKIQRDSSHSGTVPFSKSERFRKIFISACKQSGRANLPVLKKPQKFAEIFEDDSLVFVAFQNGPGIFANILDERVKHMAEVKLLVGPEGGFSPSEIEFAQKQGAVLVSFGKHTLRTEVACVAASSMLLNLLEK